LSKPLGQIARHPPENNTKLFKQLQIPFIGIEPMGQLGEHVDPSQ
jgi:hypothetical protein